MAISIAAIATQPEPPVYYTGNNEPATKAFYSRPPATGRVNAADSLPPAVTTPLPPEEAGKKCPAYLTGQDEPAAFGNFEFRILNFE